MKKLLLTLLLVGFNLALFAQETIYFPAFEMINVHFKHQYVTSKLFQTYVTTNGKYRIVLPENLDRNALYTETKAETKANALENKTSFFILSDMSAIGNLLIVNMKMYNTASGEMVWSDVLKADELEDLDPVINLLANAIGSTESAVDAGDIYSVTQFESNELNKRQATESWGISIGGGAMLTSGIDEPLISGFGIMKTFDSRNFILDIKGEFYFGEGTHASRIGMNILKPITKENYSLFYGGGLFYGGMYYSKEMKSEYYDNYYMYEDEVGDAGLEIEGNFGVIINRLSSVQIRLTVSPTIAFYSIENNAVGAIRAGVSANF